MISPIAPTPPPTGGGGVYDSSEFSLRNSPLFVVQVIRLYRNRGASVAGAEPLERRVHEFPMKIMLEDI